MPFSQAPAIADAEAIQRLVNASGARSHHRVLDVACGPGLVTLGFAEHVACVVGVDAVPAMIERARDLQAAAGAYNASFREADAAALPFPSASFDIVVSRFAFHHFEDPQRVFAEMVRVTRPEGTVVVCDAIASADPARAEALNAMERLRDPSTTHFLTAAEFRATFARAGLPRPAETSYRLMADVDGLMRISFPAPGDGDKVRRMFEDGAGKDGMGLSPERRDGRIVFGYPVTIFAARKPAENV